MSRVQLKVDEVFADLPVLESERLILRKMSEEDAHDFWVYSRDPDLLKFLPLQLNETVDDALKAIRGFQDMYAARRVAPWGVTNKADGRHIGICGFETWNPVTDRAEIGFLIAREYWRSGFASEAARRVMRFGFEEMNLNRIEARTKPENEPSKHLLLKLGLSYEGLMREHSYWKGQYHDLELYAVLRRDFVK